MNVIDEVLFPIWHQLDREGLLEPYKLWRAEDVTYDHPMVTFLMERHGSVAMGGKTAEVYRWTVDLDAMTAHRESVGTRRLRAYDKPFRKADALNLARELVESARPYFVKDLWPTSSKKTRQGRIRRLNDAFREIGSIPGGRGKPAKPRPADSS